MNAAFFEPELPPVTPATATATARIAMMLSSQPGRIGPRCLALRSDVFGPSVRGACWIAMSCFSQVRRCWGLLDVGWIELAGERRRGSDRNGLGGVGRG